MNTQDIKQAFNLAVEDVSSDLSKLVFNPGKDFSRTQKISFKDVITFMTSQGSGSTKCEWIDYNHHSSDSAYVSALNHRRSQLKPEAFRQVFLSFNQRIQNLVDQSSEQDFRLIAADGSTASFKSYPKYTSDEYYVSEGHAKKGFYSVHINALYDMNTSTYIDALLQPIHQKDEFSAFCTLVDRLPENTSIKDILVGDRGFCSYNNMAHVIMNHKYFVFRTKDSDKKGLIGNFTLPETDEFDIPVNVSLCRSNRKSIHIPEGYYRRHIDCNTSFDYLEKDSTDIFNLTFRVVRIKISDDSYEHLVTNLPSEEFTIKELKDIYNARWKIETSFRTLKYTIGLSNYHSFKACYVEQEIWARMLAYNNMAYITRGIIIRKKDTKYEYVINLLLAAHLCRLYLQNSPTVTEENLEKNLQKELIPVRPGRNYPRLKTAHFRTPHSIIYRAA